MSRMRWPARAYLGFSAAGWILMATSGCHQMVDPFHDELASRQSITTPSVEGVRTAEGAASPAPRLYTPMSIAPMDGAVVHGPLYFEDPREGGRHDDGMFAWTGWDYWAVLSGGSRFRLNAIMLPLSFVVTPPWVDMTSDGEAGKRFAGELHDARRVNPQDGT